MGALWFGFTLPSIESGQNKLIASSNSFINSNHIPIPNNIQSTWNSADILLSNSQKKDLEQFVKKVDPDGTEIIITGLYSSKENKDVGLLRSKEFKNLMTLAGANPSNIILGSSMRDNLLFEKQRILDVISIALKDANPKEVPFNIIKIKLGETPFDPLKNSRLEEQLFLWSKYIDAHPEKMIYLTYFSQNALKNVEHSRKQVKKIKKSFNDVNIPQYKIIANIEDQLSNIDRIELKLK